MVGWGRGRGGRVGQVREEEVEEAEEEENEVVEVGKVEELVEVEEEVVEVEGVGKGSLALTEESTSLGAVRIPTLATAASPKRSSSPGVTSSPFGAMSITIIITIADQRLEK